MTRSRFFLCALVAFAVLSVADFALTRYLLHGSDTAYEANPVANLMLEHHGWTGLAAFKSAATLLFVGVVAVVHCCRPRAGKRLLAFGCAALGLVVIYSTTLAVRGHAQPGPGNDAVLEDREAARLSAVQAQDIIYRSVVQQVSAGLAPGHLTLADAVERLAATEKANDRTWLRTLHAIYPGLTDRGCLAAAVVGHTLGYLNLSRADAQRLLAELYALCGTDSPTSFGPILVRCDWIQSS